MEVTHLIQTYPTNIKSKMFLANTKLEPEARNERLQYNIRDFSY